MRRQSKVHSIRDGEGQEVEYKYSSTLSLTSLLDEAELSTSPPSRITSAKQTQYPLYRRLCGLQGRSG